MADFIPVRKKVQNSSLCDDRFFKPWRSLREVNYGITSPVVYPLRNILRAAQAGLSVGVHFLNFCQATLAADSSEMGKSFDRMAESFVGMVLNAVYTLINFVCACLQLITRTAATMVDACSSCIPSF